MDPGPARVSETLGSTFARCPRRDPGSRAAALQPRQGAGTSSSGSLSCAWAPGAGLGASRRLRGPTHREARSRRTPEGGGTDAGLGATKAAVHPRSAPRGYGTWKTRLQTTPWPSSRKCREADLPTGSVVRPALPTDGACYCHKGRAPHQMCRGPGAPPPKCRESRPSSQKCRESRASCRKCGADGASY